jgi:hypothetical protein
VSTRLIAWSAAVLAMLVTLTLVVGELADTGPRRWWAAHPLTTDTVAGLLALLVTVLVVNQLLNRRQARQRGHAVAAQAAIMVARATRSVKAVSSVIDGSGVRSAASDGLPTYMIMLLTGAPLLIDDPVARRFLEQAQYLGSVMTRTFGAIDRSPDGAAVPSGRLDDAVQQLQSAAPPLLQLLSPGIRSEDRVGRPIAGRPAKSHQSGDACSPSAASGWHPGTGGSM